MGELTVQVDELNAYTLTGLADDIAEGTLFVDPAQLELATELLLDVGDWAGDDEPREALAESQALGWLVSFIIKPDPTRLAPSPPFDAESARFQRAGGRAAPSPAAPSTEPRRSGQAMQRGVPRLDHVVDQRQPLVEGEERRLHGVHREPLQVGPAVAERARPARSSRCVIDTSDISRLSVFTVTRNRSSASRPIGWSASDFAAPVCTLDVGHISSGMRLSRT